MDTTSRAECTRFERLKHCDFANLATLRWNVLAKTPRREDRARRGCTQTKKEKSEPQRHRGHEVRKEFWLSEIGGTLCGLRALCGGRPKSGCVTFDAFKMMQLKQSDRQPVSP